MYNLRVMTAQASNSRNDSGIVHVGYLFAFRPSVPSETVYYILVRVLDPCGVQSRYSFLPIVIVFDSCGSRTEHKVLWIFGRVPWPLIPGLSVWVEVVHEQNERVC